VPRVEEVLARIATQAAGFHLHIGGLGTFGRKNQPSVLWAGIHGEVNKLTWFQQVVENELEQIGFESEKRSFKLHLTLARNYQGQGDWDETQLIQSGSLKQEYSRWFADRITLYRSQLGQKPMYEPLAEYLFTGKS
jgi:2'-5' RNA ligase